MRTKIGKAQHAAGATKKGWNQGKKPRKSSLETLRSPPLQQQHPPQQPTTKEKEQNKTTVLAIQLSSNANYIFRFFLVITCTGTGELDRRGNKSRYAMRT